MKILIAPNSFKECATADMIADIFIESLRKNGFDDLIRFPISDGGDGFLQVCKNNYDLKITSQKFASCYNKSKVEVRIGRLLDKRKIYLEVADLIGLRTIPLSKRNLMQLSTENVGLYLDELQKNNCEEITIGIGGTGTNDLGLGLCVPFGLKLYDDKNENLKVIPQNFLLASRIKLPKNIECKLNVVLDVKIKLTGNKGTSKIFAEQKGATKEQIELLEAGTKNILKILKRDFNLDYSRKLIGAGGGITLGLSLLSKVNVVTSRKFLIRNLKLRDKIKSADIVISGEGKIDEQSCMEKATGILIDEVMKHNKKLILITGVNQLKKNILNGIKIYSLQDYYGNTELAIKNYKDGITELVRQISRKL